MEQQQNLREKSKFDKPDRVRFYKSQIKVRWRNKNIVWGAWSHWPLKQLNCFLHKHLKQTPNHLIQFSERSRVLERSFLSILLDGLDNSCQKCNSCCKTYVICQNCIKVVNLILKKIFLVCWNDLLILLSYLPWLLLLNSFRI